MVRTKTYKEFWEKIKTLVPSINRVKIVSDEVQIQRFIKDVEDGEVMLIAVIPSADTDAMNLDNIEMIHTCYVFILRKSSERDQDDDEWIDNLDHVQGICEDVIERMMTMAGDFDDEDADTLLMRILNPDKIHIDPEYRYMDCDGWSFAFTLKTAGIKNSDINT